MLGEGKPLRRRGRAFPSPQAPLPSPARFYRGKRRDKAVAKPQVVWFETQCVSNGKGSSSPPDSPDRHKKTVSRRQRETVFFVRAAARPITRLCADVCCLFVGRVSGTRRHSAARPPKYRDEPRPYRQRHGARPPRPVVQRATRPQQKSGEQASDLSAAFPWAVICSPRPFRLSGSCVRTLRGS